MKKKLNKFLSIATRHKIATRVISMTLSLVMLFYVIPTVVYAEITDAFSKDGGENEHTALDEFGLLDLNGNAQYTVDYPLYEVTELREENAKHFRLSDGSYIAAQYSSKIHYLDEYGLWQDIDNTLSSDGGESILTSDSRVKFAKKINGSGKILSLKNGSFSIDVSVIDGEKGAVGKVTNYDDSKLEAELQKMLNLEKLSSKVSYAEIFSGADIEFSVHSYSIDEKITINEKSKSYSYSFELKLKGLDAMLGDDGSVVFSDSTSGEVLYKLPAPELKDAAGVKAPKGTASYTLSGSDGKYVLGITAEDGWMNNLTRAYPVTLAHSSETLEKGEECSYEVATTENNVQSVTYVKINSLPDIPDGAYVSEVLLTLSDETPDTTYGIYEVTSDWSAETLSYESYLSGEGEFSDSIIDSASESYSFNITELAEKWKSNPESNYGVAIAAIDGESTARGASAATYSVRSSSPTVSAVYSTIEGLEDYLSYTSQSVGAAGNVSINNATGRLTLSIPTVSNMNELMPLTVTPVYNSYLSGKSYTSANASVPFDDMIMAYGFKLNVTESVLEKSYTTENGAVKKYYLLEDADGTSHAFFETSTAGKYTDNDGLQKTLTLSSDKKELYITDDSHIEKRYSRPTGFTATSEVSGAWVFNKATDSFGNAITVSLSNADGYPEIVSFTSGGMSSARIYIMYQSGKDVYGIFNERTKEFAIFRYSQTYNGEITYSAAKNYLRQIDYGHGSNATTTNSLFNFFLNPSSNSGLTVERTAKYEYDSSGRLTKAEDATLGQSISYTWDGSGRVSKVTQYASGTKGQELSFTYGTGFTDVKTTGNDEILNTTDDIVTRHTFDDNGRCVSVYSYSAVYLEIYGATVGKYESQENVKNNLKEKTVVGGSSVNYILNGDFEERVSKNNFSYWTLSSGAAEDTDPSLNTHGYYAAALKPNLGATAYIEQYVFLNSGTYTLSFPVFSQHGEGHAAFVEISSVAGSGLLHSEEISLNPNSSNGMRSVFSTTFNVSSYTSGGDRIKIKIYLSSQSDAPRKVVFEVDDISLIKGIGASDYSYVRYGTFDESGRTQSGNVSLALSSKWKTNSGGAPTVTSTESPFAKVARVSANNSTSYVKQRIYEIDQSNLDKFDYDYSMFYTNAKYEFVVSGFAKAASASLSENAKFELRVDVVYYQGVGKSDVTLTYSYEFLPTAEDWQFVCGSFATKHTRGANDTNSYACVKAIDVYCDYSGQSSGYALFDNISVINATDYSNTKYYYYDSGKLAMTEALTYNEYYTYDSNRNLTVFANNKGEVTKYEYNHSTSPYALTASVDYDFTYEGGYDYPHKYGASLQTLVETPKTKTVYTYNSYGMCTNTVTYEAVYGSGTSVVKKSGSKEISQSNTYVIHDTSEYTLSYACFGAPLTSTDSLGIITRNFYDTTTGRLLATVNESTGDGLSYTYDALGNLSGVTPAEYVSSSQYNSLTNEEKVSYTYNSKNLLSSITTASTTYTLNYDVFGNSSSVKAGNNTLASYEYNANNGKLKKINYGNGFSVEYVYNRLEMLTEIWYNENGVRTLAYSYEYTDDGQVHKFTDNKSSRTTVYRYDNVGKLISYAEYDNGEMYHDFSSEVYYNENTGDVSSVYYQLNYASSVPKTTNPMSYQYTRLSDGKINYTNIATKSTNGRETYTYDAYERVSGKTLSVYDKQNTSNQYANTTTYTYKNNSSGTQTSALIEKYTSSVNNTLSFENTYTYDSNGNITKIRYNDGTEMRYVYDDLGQLIREDNGKVGKTYLYAYDKAGNITSVTTCNLTAAGVTPTVINSTNSYAYSSGAWGDLLTSFKGHSITYDSIGNPLSYYNGTSYTFSWSGRQLVGAATGGNSLSFTYNDEGIRTSKTKNGVTTTYYLNGSQIMAEETNGNVTVYVYDTDGSPIGMQYHAAGADEYTWEIYWFEKNLQGDIVAVYNHAGQLLISYTYTAYGSFSMVGSNNGLNTKAASNPFTYRGYYFDSDLNLYYLGSRYYDYNTCRFINADNEISSANGELKGYNLFAYCFNNPIAFSDDNGNWPKWMKKVAKVVVAAVESLEIQVGFGFGIGGTLVGNIKAEASRDTYVGLDDGKLTTGNLITAEISIGKNFSIGSSHDHLSEKGGEKMTSSGSASDSALSMLTYPDVQHSIVSNVKRATINSDNELLIGLKPKSKHFIFGGFYSVKFNLTEFIGRLSE